MPTPRLPFDDVELAWGRPPGLPEDTPPPAHFLRLLFAFFGDLGLAALMFFLLVLGTRRWELSWSWMKMYAFAVVSLGLLTAWVEVSCLWFFRKTVGMHLVGVRFEKALKLKRAVAVWLVMLMAAPLFVLPLLAGGTGARWLEKVGGSSLIRENPHAGA